MANVYNYLPELTGEELAFVENLMKEMSEPQAKTFANIYRSRRRDPQVFLLLAIIGLLGIAGIQRFIAGQIGMGLLYLLTVGICYIGTIIDIVTYQSIAFSYNREAALESAAIAKNNYSS